MLNNTIFEFIRQYGVKSVIVGGLIEQIVVPVPSPLVPMAAGFLFVDQSITNYFIVFRELFLKAALPFAIGSTIGSTMVYLVSWYGGKWLVDKFHKWLGFDWEDIEGIQRKYFKGKSTDELLIFVFRAIPMVPSSLISAVSGAIRIKPLSFYLYTFLGLLFRGIVLGFVGWQSGEAIFKISSGLDKTEMVISVLMLLLFAAAFFFAYAKRKKWLRSIKE
jgi:membrane protein DedA with SNARE-associated domain